MVNQASASACSAVLSVFRSRPYPHLPSSGLVVELVRVAHTLIESTPAGDLLVVLVPVDPPSSSTAREVALLSRAHMLLLLEREPAVGQVAGNPREHPGGLLALGVDLLVREHGVEQRPREGGAEGLEVAHVDRVAHGARALVPQADGHGPALLHVAQGRPLLVQLQAVARAGGQRERRQDQERTHHGIVRVWVAEWSYDSS